MFQPRLTAPELRLVAEIIHSLPTFAVDEEDDPDGLGVSLTALIEHFADRLAATSSNGLFDRERFIRAATTGDNRRRDER